MKEKYDTKYEIGRINTGRNPCYIFEGGIIMPDEEGLVGLIRTD